MKNKNIIITVLITTTITFLGVAVYFYFQADSKGKELLALQQDGSIEVADKESIEETQNTVDNSLIVTDSYSKPNNSLSISGHKITVPTDWQLSIVDIAVDRLTKYPGGDGSSTLHTEDTIVITNGSSTLTMKQATPVLLGGIGFVLEEIEDESKIVEVPEGDKYGYVVEEIDGIYNFRLIVNCSGNEGDPCKKYGYMQGVSLLNTEFMGSEQDLEIMKEFYTNNILNKDFTLYRYNK